MKEDQKGPKNREIIPGLGYSKIQLDVLGTVARIQNRAFPTKISEKLSKT